MNTGTATAPRVTVRSPGRVNLMGDHVDYQGGWVLPCAIDRDLRMMVAPFDSGKLRLTSTDLSAPAVELSLDGLTPLQGPEAWANYIAGVVYGYLDRDVAVPGMHLHVDSDLPKGAGLSSSAALETATALAVETATGVSLPPLERARLCQVAEHTFAGVPCGIMDQVAVGCGRPGHALLLDCRDVSVTPVPLPAHLAMVLVNTHATHSLSDGAYADRTRQCREACELLGVDSLRDATLANVHAAEQRLEDLRFRRARHVVSEIQRVPAFVEALAHDDLPALRALMQSSHASLRDDFEVSCPELDLLVEVALNLPPEAGLIGARMTGGGFGGCTVNLVESDKASALAATLGTRYHEATGTATEPLIVQATGGASVLA